MGVSLPPVAYERIHGRQRASAEGSKTISKADTCRNIALSLVIVSAARTP